MDFFASVFSCIASFFTSIDYTPLKQFIDLNDARNLAAIVGVIIAVYAASKKWGAAAIYQAQISYTQNKPARITSLSIANLKDKPLVVYRALAKFNSLKAYVTIQKFDPPLVIEGLQATSIEPDEFSGLSFPQNPFSDPFVKMDLMLVTESTVVKCKPAKIPETLIRKHMKGFNEIGKYTNKLNGKVYTSDAAYAILYQFKGETRTSFLLNYGYICEDWPFQFNAIPAENMASEESVLKAVEEISKQIGVPLQLRNLAKS
jgi:hypothetical protein